MTAYFVKLLVMLPLVAGLAYACLWGWKRLQPGMASQMRKRHLAMVDALSLGPAGRIAVVEFAGQHLLVAVSRNGIALLSQTPAPPTTAPPIPARASDDA